VCIDFPAILCPKPGHPKKPGHRKIANVILDSKNVSILKNIRRGCANLRTLTAFIYTYREPWPQLTGKLDVPEDPKFVAEAFKLIDTHFKAISSLQKIVVKIAPYREDLNELTRKEMESHGWLVGTGFSVFKLNA
jgi:hypothetical protein